VVAIGEPSHSRSKRAACGPVPNAYELTHDREQMA
jgi:hypothetical protein